MQFFERMGVWMKMADMLAVRNDLRLQNWAEVVRAKQESGLTNREFCAQNGIAEKTYYYWLRKVRQAALECGAPELVRLEEELPAADRMIRIRYGSAELTLPENVDLAAVADLLDSLRHG